MVTYTISYLYILYVIYRYYVNRLFNSQSKVNLNNQAGFQDRILIISTTSRLRGILSISLY